MDLEKRPGEEGGEERRQQTGRAKEGSVLLPAHRRKRNRVQSFTKEGRGKNTYDLPTRERREGAGLGKFQEIRDGISSYCRRRKG